MNKNRILTSIGILMAGVLLSGCNDFLDVNPDNRTTIDSPEKVSSILVSAYPGKSYVMVTEIMSDNADEYTNNYSDRFLDEVYRWEDVTETSPNDSPTRLWRECYSAIANANTALKGIEDLGGATTTELRECKGEALIARAYAHFLLVNLFCMNYNSQTSSKDMGVPYMYDTDSRIGQVHDRETVAAVYEKMGKDIEEGLPLVGDSHLKVLKFHFNRKAAYAFATRYYLFHEEWAKAIECANACLGNAPQTMLRDWKSYENMQRDRVAYSLKYTNAQNNCNLLLLAAASDAGLAFNNYRYYKKYTHGPYLDNNETFKAPNIWGTASYYDHGPFIYTVGSNVSYDIPWRIPYLFQETDVVAHTGYRTSIFPVITADECLLNRAEAYIMLKQYDNAAADLTLWMQNILNTSRVLTPASIVSFYKPLAYSYDDATKMASTIKKHLHPKFTIDAEGSTQECMLQCLLSFKRIETLHLGLRWFDIKRYGIEIIRRRINTSGVPEEKTDSITTDDPRRAIQIPTEVHDGGLPLNPRTK